DECRGIWSKHIGAAIASLGWGEIGEDVFVEWSAQTTIPGYFPGDEACCQEIRSYKRGRDPGCVTEATIYRKALDAGWVPPPWDDTADDPNDTRTLSGPPPGFGKQIPGEEQPFFPLVANPAGPGSPVGKLAELRWYGEQTRDVNPRWLVKNLLPETGVGLFSGQWGTGKTFVVLNLACSVMLETTFANYRCKRSGGVFYIAAEGGSQILIRLRAIIEKKFPLHPGPIPFAWLDYCPPFSPRPGESGLVQFA